jgi:SAM-dependent methyltransferase
MSLFYRIKLPFFEWKEQRWVEKQFYSDPTFKKLDQALLSGPNPYREARIFPYGETPLRALYAMGLALNLKPTDCFVDLGCGRGRAVFFLSHVFGCQAIGVDLTPSFITRARRLKAKYGVKKVSFECCDFLKFDFSRATCVYLYGTTYSDACLQAVEHGFAESFKATRIVTVSASFLGLEYEKEIEVNFPWGKGSMFVHSKTCSTMQGSGLVP